MKEINENFLGPYDEAHFNGKEAEVIVYVSSSEYGLFLQSMARARRLLIIITHGRHWNDDSKEHVKAMKEATEKNLVKKFEKVSKVQHLKNFFQQIHL